MEMEFFAKVTETPESEGWNVDHIELRLPDGRELMIDADETGYSIEPDGRFDVIYRGVYILTDDEYDVDPKDFEGAEITDIVEDDEDYGTGYRIEALTAPSFW